ncbi:T9SS type B sorting domain-containing protein, partial [Litoribacter populi]
GNVYNITAQYIPISNNLQGSITTNSAEVNVLNATVTSSVAENGKGNVVVFEGAASSFGLPSSTTLTASFTPSLANVSYKWWYVENGVRKTVTNNGSTLKVNASGDFVREYDVEISNNGVCAASATFKVISVEASCGNGGNKVQVCQVPPGNPNARKTICVNANAVQALLANSDSFIGSCNVSYREGEEPGFEDATQLLGDLVTVSWKTSFEELQTSLNKIGSELMNGENAQIKWFSNGYDPIVAGFYEINGEVISVNARNIGSIIIPILVEDKALPTNILLSSEVIAKGITAGSSIADLTTVDEADDVHEYALDNGLLDNSFFSIANGRLIWNSTESVNSRISYQVAIQSTDRVGNMISRNFMLYAEKSGLDKLEIFNTFTPDNDGVNDTWGVEELKAYQNIRITIFDRGGKQVFQTDDAKVQWDGTHQGRALPVGAYFYVIETGHGDMRRGTLNLLRK